MKKILILTNNDAGFWNFRKEIVVALIEEGVEVHISTPDTGYSDKLVDLGASVIPTMVDRRGVNLIEDLKLFFRYRQLISKVQPDAVLTYTIKPTVYGGIACALMHIPYMATITGLGGAVLDGGVMQKITLALYKIGLRKAHTIFFQNEINREFMQSRGCISSKSGVKMVAGSGVNLEENQYQSYPVASDRVDLLSVGRIMNYKGSKEILDVAGPIHKRHPEVVFHICGGYEEDTRAIYEPRVNELIKEGAVIHHGFQEDVRPFYKMCNALVHPSYGEGVSNVLLEAAAIGRPLLASDIPGCREVYEEGEGGLSYPMRDSKALEDTIERFLMLGHNKWKQMGKSAHEYVCKRFNREQVVATYIDVIKKILYT